MRRRRSSSHDAASYAPRTIRDYYGPFGSSQPLAAPPNPRHPLPEHPIPRDGHGARDDGRRWAPSYDRGYSTAASRSSAPAPADWDSRHYRPDERRSWSARGFHRDHRYTPPPPPPPPSSIPDRPHDRERERWAGPRDDFRDGPAPDRRFYTRDHDNEAAAADADDAWDTGSARTHAHAWPPRRPPPSSSDPHGLITPFANSGRGPARPHPHAPTSSSRTSPSPRPPRAPRADLPQPKDQRPPTPSAAYLALAAAPSTALPDPPPPTARKLLVLDLNGTLLLRSARAPWSARPHPSRPSSSSSKPTPRTVHPRAYLPAFRAYLFAPRTSAWLDVVVWSSAQPHNVQDMVARAFAEDRARLGAVWARDTMGLAPDRYFRKVQTLKDLNKLWTELPALPGPPSSPSHPSSPLASSPPSNPDAPSDSDAPARVRHSAQSTLLLDDSHKKAALQPHNHVCVPEYTQALRNRDLEALRAERAPGVWAGTAGGAGVGVGVGVGRGADADADAGAGVDAAATTAAPGAAAAPSTTPRAPDGRTADAIAAIAAIDAIDAIDAADAMGEDEDEADGDDVLGSHKRKRRSTKQKRAEKAARERERERAAAAASASASASTGGRTVAQANTGIAVDAAGASATAAAAAATSGDAGADGGEVQAVRPPVRPPAFDETLLAVVGILHAARTQSSVAGWIRAGALWGAQGRVSGDAGDAGEAGEAGESDGSVEEGERGKRRRRSSAEEEEEEGKGEEEEEGRGKEEGKEGGAEEAAAVPVPVWFEHALAVGYWAGRGRAALEALGIPVEHGLER